VLRVNVLTKAVDVLAVWSGSFQSSGGLD